jgi:hypothetical protein
MGDLNEWMTVTQDDDHASTADVKAGVEQAKGLRPAMQELFRYDESWTGTEGSGGGGHSAAQEAGRARSSGAHGATTQRGCGRRPKSSVVGNAISP